MKNPKWFSFFSIAFFLFCPFPLFAFELDTTFGSGRSGSVSLASTQNGGFYDMLLQDDGKILLLGNISDQLSVVRLTPTGQMDDTFNNRGSLRVFVRGGIRGTALILQNDGKIIVIGSLLNVNDQDEDTVITRLLPDGRVDNTFFVGDDEGRGRGYRIFDFGNGEPETINAAALQADGKIVLAGKIDTQQGGLSRWDVLIARLNGNGTLNQAFGTNGKAVVDFGGNEQADEAFALSIEISGKTVVAGTGNGLQRDVIVARFLANGVLDNTFNRNGMVITNFGGSDTAHSIAFRDDQNGHKILIAGEGNIGIILGCYNDDGTLDRSFDGDGKKFISPQNIGIRYNTRSFVVQHDGKILVGGNDRNSFMFWRLMPNGSLDNAFGQGGVASWDPPSPPDMSLDDVRLRKILYNNNTGQLLAAGHKAERNQQRGSRYFGIVSKHLTFECSNNLREGNEECDDGDRINDDRCTNQCRNAVCGDGIQRTDIQNQQLPTYEACDDGNRINDDRCNNSCRVTRCGDGIVQANAGELCEPNINVNVACNPETCIPVSCGNRAVDDWAGEGCDESVPGTRAGTCRNCILTGCGDGVVQSPNGIGVLEICDDGNQNPYDACVLGLPNQAICQGRQAGSDCQRASCGDGLLRTDIRDSRAPSYEECDDCNNIDGDGCSGGCIVEYCGDWSVQPPDEECDDGGNNSPNGRCNGICHLTSCGDGFVQNPNGAGQAEECDALGARDNLGNLICTNDCRIPVLPCRDDPRLGQVCQAGVGACERAGVFQCVNNRVACDARPGNPAQEICDNQDNDCDGQIDESRIGGPLTRECYGGPPGTLDVGECADGNQACRQGEWGECVGDILPQPEKCNNKDDDCDRSVDEDFIGLRNACQLGVGVCSANGVWVCSQDVMVCNAEIRQPAVENCDGLDNDCDGVIDEDCNCRDGEARPCGSGVGACREGEQRCANGQWGVCAGGIQPVIEVCDGQDNDCSGLVDENLRQRCYSGPQGTEGIGICAGGVQICEGGRWQICFGEQTPLGEACNRVDDDCDGVVDPGCVCQPGEIRACGSDVGICLPGRQACENGQWAAACIGAVGPGVEICDGLDNDCDGEVNENLQCNQNPPPPAPVCGNNQREGNEECDDGNIVGGDGCSAQCTNEAPVVLPPPVQDRDGDGILDNVDNCPDIPNADQADDNQNGVGNACEVAAVGVVAEVCDDGQDNDGDGGVDCVDNDCAQQANCAGQGAQGGGAPGGGAPPDGGQPAGGGAPQPASGKGGCSLNPQPTTSLPYEWISALLILALVFRRRYNEAQREDKN